MNSGATSAEPAHADTFVLEWCLRDDSERRREPVEPGNVPRVSRLMALAVKFDGLIRRGEVEDYATLARLGHVTPARITQIMSLLNLAPDIQEAILFLPRTARGHDPITERNIRAIASIAEWDRQREAWQRGARGARIRSSASRHRSRRIGGVGAVLGGRQCDHHLHSRGRPPQGSPCAVRSSAT